MADTPESTKTPWHLWVVGIVSLLWNLVGAMDFVMTESRNSSYLKEFTSEQLDFFFGFPVWVVAAWGIAVWGGVVGSLLMLFRKALAVCFFLASLICMILTTIHNYVLSNGLKVMGGVGPLIFSAVIFLICVLLWLYARSMRRRGVLR